MVVKRIIEPWEVMKASQALIDRLGIQRGKSIYGVPRGGVPVALTIAALAGAAAVNNPAGADFIVDDIYDSGATSARFDGKPFGVLFDKRQAPWAGQWLVMPWEATETTDHSAEDAVTRLLQFIGEDVTREGLRGTPARVIAAWAEWTAGYRQNPVEVLKTFEDGACDEMVIVHDIPVISKCEHHLADIVGVAHVGYIPNGRIVGLSKLARLTEIFARRLQVQERLTAQIADVLMEEPLKALGAGVLIRAEHHCMSTRGVRIHGSKTTTSAMRGVLFIKPEARAEFLKLCEMAR